jgi:hypothetical protein
MECFSTEAAEVVEDIGKMEAECGDKGEGTQSELGHLCGERGRMIRDTHGE